MSGRGSSIVVITDDYRLPLTCNNIGSIMPLVLLTILKTIGSLLVTLLTSLLTEKFLKKAIVAVLEAIANKTANTLDNQLVAAAREAWDLPAAEKKEETTAP